MIRISGVELNAMPQYPGLSFGVSILLRVVNITYKLLKRNPGSIENIDIKTSVPGMNANIAVMIPKINPPQPISGKYFNIARKVKDSFAVVLLFNNQLRGLNSVGSEYDHRIKSGTQYACRYTRVPVCV